MSSIVDAPNAAVTNQIKWFKTNDFCVCKDLHECFQKDLFCDVTLIADDGKRISAHRNVLYAANDYFKALFSTGFKECGQQKISIKEVDGVILELLVQYCYKGEIGIDIAYAEELTKAANMLRFTEVKKHCAEFYSNKLSPSTCLGIREIADLHNMGPLKKAAHDFVLDNFVEASKCEEFHQLSAEHLSELLKDDEINVTSEEEVFMALMDWIKFDVNSRKQSLETLFECVRFKDIKETFSYEVFQQCVQINSVELISRIIALKSLNQYKYPRPSTTSNTFNVAYLGTGTEIEIDRYNSHRNIWKKVKTINLKITCCGMVSRNTELIIIGGADAEGQAINTVKSINLKSNEFVDLEPLISPRTDPSAVLLNDSIYVCGGVDSNCAGVFSVERFDFKANEWTLGKEMNTPRYNTAHVILSGTLLAIGGIDKHDRYISSVEYYVPLTDSWHTVAPMRQRRDSCSACAMNGFIFVFGGWNETAALQSLERYDPRENTWTEMQFDIPVPTYYVSPVLCLQDWVYLAGGFDKDQKPRNSFYKINVMTGEVLVFRDLRKRCGRGIFIPSF